LRSLVFDPSAFDDLAWWIEQDRAQAVRMFADQGILRDPFTGIGRPEPLALKGMVSELCGPKKIPENSRK
jgi:Txe/YoeB family toxin of Txe-Axe toxin-antitoxin module